MSVIPGLSGPLLSELFVESQLAPFPIEPATLRYLSRWRRAGLQFGPASSVRALLDGAAAPLLAALGFGAPTAAAVAGATIAANVPAPGGDGVLTVLVTPFGSRLDQFWRTAVVESLRRGSPWAFLFNGCAVRLVDAEHTYARRFVELDVDLGTADPRTASVLDSLLRRAVARGTRGTTALHDFVNESDRHAAGVCRSLRLGVLSASTNLLGALTGSRRPVPLGDAFEQSLTIVYRLLFLLFAEARALVPVWHPVYRESYSVEALRAAAERPPGSAGLWDALSAMARLAHAGCEAGDLRVTPFNGRLFAPAGARLSARRGLDDEAARRAVLALSTRPSARGNERISYRDLGVEQLGAVYETLLDYQPRVVSSTEGGARVGPRIGLERGSGVRKATGSFYTPEPIAAYLVRRALGPLVHEAPPNRILSLRIVDPAMGSGAILVAACRFLADAYEQALVEAGACHPADLADADRAAMRRAIAERCLYGVDANPMAVQLARLSLWLTTLAADRPLTFLDHRLRTGDSLLGVPLAHLVRRPRRLRRTPESDLPLFGPEDVEPVLRALVPVRLSLEQTPDDTLQQVQAKERTFADLNRRGAPLADWKRVADAWCAPWFGQVPAEGFTALADAILGGRGALPPAATGTYLDRVSAIAAERRFFHWELEFPEAFFDADGRPRERAGFDAVIGNPPWDMVRAEGQSTRQDALATLRFTRDSGLYTAQSDGHANRYQLFLERAIALTRPGGRIGLVLPSGLATDHGSARLRRRLLRECEVDALVGFDNRRAVFPIHRSVRFLLLTATTASTTRSILCRLGEQDPSALATSGDGAPDADWYPVRLTPALIERISGEDLAIPDLRSPADVTIVERAAALFPALGSDSGWGVRFGRELNATDDRKHLQAGGEGLPVLEGKHLRPFSVDATARRLTIPAATARRLLAMRGFEHRRLGYRDVASASNRQTLIAAVLPAACVSTHTISCLRTPLPMARQHLLCGLFNSFVVNYLVRLRVTTHVTTRVVEGLPLPRVEDAPSACRDIGALARLLSRRWNGDDAARLNALVASVYQLSPAELRHVLETFPLVPSPDREATLSRFLAL
jgi:hypothetical protein